MTIRGFYRAVKVEGYPAPYDTIHLKILYPAANPENPLQQAQGLVPPDPAQVPLPVVIFCSGINCSALLYQWFALELAQRGFAVVTYDWVAENIPGAIALTPGVDLTQLKPETYGTQPTASALPTLFAELERLQSDGVLAGTLNLDQVILGGHSAGGRVALESADPKFYPQVVGAFGYGVHTAAPMMLGFAPETILPLPSGVPLLLMGGTCDGVIAANCAMYGINPPSATTAIVRTFGEAIHRQNKDSYLAIFEGANHFAIAHPIDPTIPPAFLDFPATQPEAEIQALIAQITGLFIEACVQKNSTASTELDRLFNEKNPLLARFERK